MRLTAISASIFLIISPSTLSANQGKTEKAAAEVEALADPIEAPDWFTDDIEFLTRDGGRWLTSNADYQSENEPFEAYGLEWKKGYANSMTGRLFAIRDGEETGDFWRFVQYWHPGNGKAVVQQFGAGGAMGIGKLWPDSDGVNKMKQTFYNPDGSFTMNGHTARNPDADTHITESFNIVDGEWQSNRIYTWRRDHSPHE